MTTDDDLRSRFAAASAPAPLDAAAIIAGARRRRRPRVIAAGTVGALATVGVLVLGIQVALPPDPGTVTSMESAPAADAPAGGASDTALTERASAASMNLCGAPVVEALPNTLGLALEPVFPASAAAGATVEGVVRLTNTGTERFTGSAAPTPAVAVAEDGLVVWHTNGPAILSLVFIDLGPGESMEFGATATAVRCGPEDDAAPAFREDLPPLAPGDYTISVLMDITPDGQPVELVASDPVALTVD